MENVAFLNEYMQAGKFFAKRNSRFAEDCTKVQIDWERSTPDKIVVKDNYHSDIIDAVLYAFKESPAFTYQAQVPKPKYLTPDWHKAEVERMEQEAEEYFAKKEEQDNGWV
jgi:hypothetical protein